MFKNWKLWAGVYLAVSWPFIAHWAYLIIVALACIDWGIGLIIEWYHD